MHQVRPEVQVFGYYLTSPTPGDCHGTDKPNILLLIIKYSKQNAFKNWATGILCLGPSIYKLSSQFDKKIKISWGQKRWYTALIPAFRRWRQKDFKFKAMPTWKILRKKKKSCEVPVAHTCNPKYSGGRVQEDCSSKPAQANKSWNPFSKNQDCMSGSSGKVPA
jgi:hypothetical protein